MIGPDINEINLCLKDTVLQMGKKKLKLFSKIKKLGNQYVT